MDAFELRDWSITKDQIGQQLKKHYQACMKDGLPPRLRAVLKRLDEEEPEQSSEHTHSTDQTEK
jgi:hypothetical protein